MVHYSLHYKITLLVGIKRQFRYLNYDKDHHNQKMFRHRSEEQVQILLPTQSRPYIPPKWIFQPYNNYRFSISIIKRQPFWEPMATRCPLGYKARQVRVCHSLMVDVSTSNNILKWFCGSLKRIILSSEQLTYIYPNF